VGALLLMCDPRDLGVALSENIEAATMDGRPDAWEPNLYLYDMYSGGIGLSAPLYRLSDRLLGYSAELIAACGCDEGCPACVGPAGEIGDRGKQAAVAILAALSGTAGAPAVAEAP
jgi:DEAD/DEAH box helicase domain-containing protein